MANFLILYKGYSTSLDDMDDEQLEEIDTSWKKWMKTIGDALVDIGSPTDEGESLVDDGSEGNASEVSGYSIIEADDMDHAKELCEDHPFLSEGKGNYSIDIFELMPVDFS